MDKLFVLNFLAIKNKITNQKKTASERNGNDDKKNTKQKTAKTINKNDNNDRNKSKNEFARKNKNANTSTLMKRTIHSELHDIFFMTMYTLQETNKHTSTTLHTKRTNNAQ